MDLIEKVKEALTPPNEVEVTSTTEPTTWATFVESMDSARKKAGEMMTIPETSGWWNEAAAFIEETRISVEEKISEITGPSEIKDDPLKSLRMDLTTYADVLEQLKQETFNLGMAAENMARLGSGGLGRAVADCFGEASTVKDQFMTYKEKHEQVFIPILDEVRSGVEKVTALVADETTKIQSVLARFKRRDRLHRSLVDMKARVDLRREKNNRKVAEGLVVDSKAMEELYELTRTMDSIESDFRITSEQLVNKCTELIKNKSKSFHSIFLKVVDVQNTFFYRVGGSCSIPFADMQEAFKNDVPSEDEMEDLGPHPLTWRDNGPDLRDTQNAEFMSLKSAPLRRSTVNINKTDLTTSPPANPAANRFSYRRPGSTSPLRKAGTSALLEDVPSPK